MKTKTLNVIWFSATNTTKEVIRLIADELDVEERYEHDLTNKYLFEELNLNSNNLLLIGMPVYSGRIPRVVLSSLRQLKGNNAPAIIICTYGNRDYDDALLELKKVVTKNGFKVISAGAFIAQHSIFPAVGKNRPDIEDEKTIKEFAQASRYILSQIKDIESVEDIYVKGNTPFVRSSKKIPFQPKTKQSKCDLCRTCYKTCPVSAISFRNPGNIEKDVCISCARCIAVCPQKARHFGGLPYFFAKKKFALDYKERKEPEMFFVDVK